MVQHASLVWEVHKENHECRVSPSFPRILIVWLIRKIIEWLATLEKSLWISLRVMIRVRQMNINKLESANIRKCEVMSLNIV